MTEIPEHLLQRSKERRKALGLPVPGEEGGEAAVEAAPPAEEAPAAEASAEAPAAEAPAAAEGAAPEARPTGEATSRSRLPARPCRWW